MVRGTICPTYPMRLCNKKIEISPLALFRYGPGTQVVYKYPGCNYCHDTEDCFY